MDKWVGKTAVVTGASSGIGACIATSLAKAGINVIGLARRKDRVEALAQENKALKGKIQAFACDISDPKSINSAFEWIEKTTKIHIFINNAGCWYAKNLLSDELTDEEVISTVDTNFTGLALCSRKAIKLLEKNGEPGYVININSISGQKSAHKGYADAGINVYQATKQAVTSVTEILRYELATKPKNCIRISSLSPGGVQTDIHHASSEALKELPMLKPENIADGVVYLLGTPSSVNVSELTILATNSPF